MGRDRHSGLGGDVKERLSVGLSIIRRVRDDSGFSRVTAVMENGDFEDMFKKQNEHSLMIE